MEFNIDKTEVYGIEESIVVRGYPMSVEIEHELRPSDLDRIIKLSSAKLGSGHDCALKGITVQTDVTAPQYWWQQFQRYHFADIISSQSKMHRITKMDIKEQCNKYVFENIIKEVKKLVGYYNENNCLRFKDKQELFQVIISNCPMGLMLTARITTNYLQLKTMYNQRKNHKLEEWEIFCEWVEQLPHSMLITGKEDE